VTELSGKLSGEVAKLLIKTCFEIVQFDDLRSIREFLDRPRVYILQVPAFKVVQGVGVRARLEFSSPKVHNTLLISYKNPRDYGQQLLDPILIDSFRATQEARLTSLIKAHSISLGLWYDPVELWEYDILSKLGVTLLTHPNKLQFKALLSYVLKVCTVIDNFWLVVTADHVEFAQANIDTYLFISLQASPCASVIIPESPVADLYERTIRRVLKVWEAWASCDFKVVHGGGWFELEVARLCAESCPELSSSLVEVVKTLFDNSAPYLPTRTRWLSFLQDWLQGKPKALHATFQSGPVCSLYQVPSRDIAADEGCCMGSGDPQEERPLESLKQK
jgi:hypothetical protein